MLISGLRRQFHLAVFPVFLAAIAARDGLGGELVHPAAAAPKIAAASNEGELAMKAFQLPAGFKVELFAAEPHLANPVAFHIDNENRFWVSETFRLHAGVTDIRGKMSWLDEDLASRSADERLAMMKRHEGEKILSYEQNTDRVKLVVDKDGDGRADHSTVFADGFNHALDGIAAGVLSRDGSVYFANLPNLWLLKDRDNDGVAEERRSLHYGYGVRVGFLGHDLHGLVMGPDGRLYFTIGDRGANIEQDGNRVGDPDTGAVFRCNPDGSELEVFAFGLRNPQELAFDEYGNLFTGDNNSDGGDRARLVYLVKGGDSGWRIGWQFLERPNARGAWNSERMWHPAWEGQPAYIVPPIANLSDGPSGFAYYPGTGLPDKYLRNFFLVDFHGGKGSGIYTFELRPKGSFFELAEVEKFVWESLPTDVAFGPEPGLYFTDWVQGWGMTGKGRIYRVFEPESAGAKKARETGELLKAGFKKRSVAELEKLLSHDDMRVRLEAQFELAGRESRGMEALARAATRKTQQLARLHGIWGLGQLARAAGAADKGFFGKTMRALAKDSDAEVRAQTLKVIGDARLITETGAVIAGLADENDRVRVHAAIAAGDLKQPEAIEALIGMLEKADNKDAVQRHAASYALAEIGQFEALRKLAGHESSAVRMGILLAMRRLERAEIAHFLRDSSPLVALEAARAINDLPISGAIPELAALANSGDLSSARPELLRRIVNANYRYGTRESAQALARLASDSRLDEATRADALNNLGNWLHPSGRDQITGLWRPTAGPRNSNHAAEAIEPQIASILSGAPDPVRAAAAGMAAKLRLNGASEPLLAVVRSEASSTARVAALRALADLNDERLAEAVELAQKDANEEMRKEALRFQSRLKPSGAITQIESALQNGSLGEKQSALGTLASMQNSAADAVIQRWMDRLAGGQVEAGLQLDVLEAAARRADAALKTKLEGYQATLAKENALGEYTVALHGGNKEEGRKIFFERAEASCVRCHKIQGENSEGGGVGPDLTKIGTKGREYLLESLIFPNKQIAEGFETLLVTTRDGTSFAGTLVRETEQELVINSPEDGEVSLKKAEIKARERGLSSMPESLVSLLSKQDVRNLVEYLSSLN